MNRQEKTIIIISTTTLSVALIVTLLLPRIFNILDPMSGQFAGLVLKSQGDVRIRFGDSINWKKLSSQDKVYSNSYLFTGKESSANFGFVDESTLNLGANSLVYIGLIQNKLEKSKIDHMQIELVNGKMQMDLKQVSKIQSIKIADAVIELNKNSSIIRLENTQDSMEVSIMQGEVKLTSRDGTYNVKSGEKLEVKSGESSKVSPLSPELIQEMKRLSAEDRKLMLAEYQKGRNISSLIAGIISRFLN
jgi:hypothetical protein